MRTITAAIDSAGNKFAAWVEPGFGYILFVPFYKLSKNIISYLYIYPSKSISTAAVHSFRFHTWNRNVRIGELGRGGLGIGKLGIGKLGIGKLGIGKLGFGKLGIGILGIRILGTGVLGMRILGIGILGILTFGIRNLK